MAILLLANIGNSDLWLSGAKLEKDKQREEAKLILDDFESMHSELTLPILAPMIEDITTTHPQIDQVVLFSTDQPISVGERFHGNDTLFTARVIERLLLEDDRFRGKIKAVTCAQPMSFRPNSLDKMMQWFAENLDRSVPPGDYSDIYISVTGGTPAANQALFFHAIYSLKSKGQRRLIYTSESGAVEHPGTIAALDKEFQLALIRNFLEQYNYAAVLESLRARGFRLQRIVHLIESCELRLNFRLEEAQQKVGQWRSQLHGEEARWYIQLDERLKKLRKGIDELASFYQHQNLSEGIKAVFVELYNSLRLQYEGGRYVDMMARLFRLQEGLLRLLCEMKLAIRMSDNRQFAREVERVMEPSLQQHLLEHRIDLKRTRKFYTAVIDYYATEFTNFKKWNDKVNPLVEERNRMIIGHEFEGASKTFIESKYQGNLLDETATMLRRVLQLDELPDDLPEINEFILKQIRRHFE